MQYTQYTQDTLFPDTAVQTTGWAQPHADDQAEQAVEETQAEAA